MEFGSIESIPGVILLSCSVYFELSITITWTYLIHFNQGIGGCGRVKSIPDFFTCCFSKLLSCKFRLFIGLIEFILLNMALLTLVIFPFLSFPLIHLLFFHLRLCFLYLFWVLSTPETLAVILALICWGEVWGIWLLASASSCPWFYLQLQVLFSSCIPRLFSLYYKVLICDLSVCNKNNTLVVPHIGWLAIFPQFSLLHETPSKHDVVFLS